MPIYEFYCKNCNTIFNFFSQRINTTKKPKCPECKTKILSRQMSVFAYTGSAKENSEIEGLPFDENKMEKAMHLLEREAENINEDDPRQAADLMRKLTDMTGLELGDGINEALSRMEQGEDPDVIEAEMGDILDGQDPFLLSGKKGKKRKSKLSEPFRDNKLYDL
ncbi:MAG: zinc ribbon domain-containing protein [Desulfobacterales bacterium]|jgi:putative FmdB family regulatory protein|nr:zinc ribbon domain-containing protein [Desulfobacteraceae bacterium]MBT4364389.1 zinc ribbon domain-containing protein [Desulfobacteraceae bacterium]MBT7085715.1 zinc ribbon domain-containing protein [Desulfobacterales bacterium]MBT7696250.1 zinc ribbon domain-containing protein [Desulfobacterales bacterium]